MPIFTFKCQTCNSIFDKLVKFNDTSVQCMKCSDFAVKQLSAPAGFKLVGDGFYAPTKTSEVS